MFIRLQSFAVLLAIFYTISAKSYDKADIKDFPFMVSLLDDDLDEFLGLGVIVSKNVVFAEEMLENIEEVRIRVGSAQWTTGGKVIKAKELIDFHYYTLIILEEDLEFSDTIQPVEFSNDPHDVTENLPLNIVGWGYTNTKSKIVSDFLLYFPSNVLDTQTCDRVFSHIYDEVPDFIPMFCSTHPPGVGVFDDTESVAVAGNILHGFGVYRDVDKFLGPALFLHMSMLYKKIQKTINMYS